MEQQLEQLRACIARAPDIDEGLQLLREVGRLLGFTAIGVVFDVAGNRPQLDTRKQSDLLGWPDEIVTRWTLNGYSRQYPVYMRCRFSNKPFAVDNAVIFDPKHPRTRAQAQMQSDITDLGLRTMLTVPVHLALGQTAAINWISHALIATDEMLDRYGYLLFAIGHTFMTARTHDCGRKYDELKYLTNRQIDCLALLAVGKSLHETGQILHISDHTVRDHIRSITERLNASNTTHAVALATQLGIIDQLRHDSEHVPSAVRAPIRVRMNS
jgi:LuxR family quorum sensing-dependent transcriptional regulator